MAINEKREAFKKIGQYLPKEAKYVALMKGKRAGGIYYYYIWAFDYKMAAKFKRRKNFVKLMKVF